MVVAAFIVWACCGCVVYVRKAEVGRLKAEAEGNAEHKMLGDAELRPPQDIVSNQNQSDLTDPTDSSDDEPSVEILIIPSEDDEPPQALIVPQGETPEQLKQRLDPLPWTAPPQCFECHRQTPPGDQS
tara:strand:- start:137 stop:520 length:384 start_codon:yes stop_codon:yes gene_type:complete